MLANPACQPMHLQLTHRSRQQAGSYSKSRCSEESCSGTKYAKGVSSSPNALLFHTQ